MDTGGEGVSPSKSQSNEMEDDDVVIMGEEVAKPGGRGSYPWTLDKISKTIAEAKEAASHTEEELKLMNEELENMQTNLSDEVYQSLRFLVDNPKCVLESPLDEAALDKMITSVLESLTPEEIGDLSKEEYMAMNDKLNTLEKTNQSVSNLFLDCHGRLKDFKQTLLTEGAELEKEIKEYESRISQACLLIDSDEEDDEDIAVIGSSLGTPGKLMQSSKGSSKSPKDKQSAQQRKPATPSQFDSKSQSSYASQPMPSMEELRSKFASAVSKSMPTLLSSLQSQHPPYKPQPSSVQTSTSAEKQQPKPAMSAVKWPVLKVMDKVLGKKFNDVWYSGTILDIYPPNSSEGMEWRCKVKFDRKGMKILPGRHVAYRDPITCFIRVGTRVVALYKEDDAPNSFFAGVIAEAPSIKNNRRFLVFFDDGYAQYCDAKELHKVYTQSVNVWEDINPDTSAFIKEYLRIYPERPMVRLSKGQVVRTEWNGKWWTAKVQETDASLVKMYFQADKRTEWIYRGSTRLEPLFKALANADAIKAAGSAKGRRHNLTMRPSDGLKKPSVEYTRGQNEEDNSPSATASPPTTVKAAKPAPKPSDPKKRSNVAKKSTGGAGAIPSDSNTPGTSSWTAPWIKYQRKASPGAQRSLSTDSASKSSEKGPVKVMSAEKPPEPSIKSSSDIASVLQERLATSNPQVEYDEEKATGERQERMIDTKDKIRKKYEPHTCGKECLKDLDDDPEKFKGHNCLLIPLLVNWERQVCKARPAAKRFVVYRAPCGRRLRSIEEVDKYLSLTDSNLSIDLFSFDQQLHVNTEFVPVKTFCDIKDLSYGKENYPISCVNGIDRHYPDYVEYSGQRIPAAGVNLNLDPDFLACCDCTDNCRDKDKCACQQMTIQNTAWTGEADPDAGYHYRRLLEPIFTGIVECNSRCRCDKRCANRVAQLGLSKRLQVFKTGKKGWGLRCLDDIAKGSFICIYAGQLLTDKGANEDGKQYGDEYLAELDFIEVVERQKEGYESDVEDVGFSDDENDTNYKASKDSEDDSDYERDNNFSIPAGPRRRSERRKTAQSDSETKTETEEKEKMEEDKKDTGNQTNKKVPEADTSVEDPISISDDDDDEDEEIKASEVTDKKEEKEKEEKEDIKEKEDMKEKEDEKPEAPPKAQLKPRAKKSTGGSRFNLSTTYKTSQEPVPEKGGSPEKKERAPTRSFFQDDTECYIMDAKSMGNLGRYLNHSCTPNVFVQNIFVDTHDLRFPWVAFFAGQYIRAGTELTWDYNYEVGSVPDKVLYCYCGSSMCRGRLL